MAKAKAKTKKKAAGQETQPVQSYQELASAVFRDRMERYFRPGPVGRSLGLPDDASYEDAETAKDALLTCQFMNAGDAGERWFQITFVGEDDDYRPAEAVIVVAAEHSPAALALAVNFMHEEYVRVPKGTVYFFGSVSIEKVYVIQARAAGGEE